MSQKQSLSGRIWNIRNIESGKTVFEKLCSNRGLHNEKTIHEFFHKNTQEDLFDPFLLQDMTSAIRKILESVRKNEKIMIYGDYDVDGISGTAIIYSALKILNAVVSYRLPHRLFDGYGLNKKHIDEFNEIGVKLLITVDCGTSNTEEIRYAKSHGMDAVVIDHHSVPENISDITIVNPKRPDCLYPFKDLCGAGLAYKLAKCLLIENMGEEKTKKYTDKLIDLAALGIVADCVPLVSENRVLLKYGLEKLRNTENIGLKTLFDTASIKKDTIDSHTIGFMIAPRLNAAGRIASPYHSIQLLLEKPEHALVLEELNQKRKKMVEKFLLDAEEQIKQSLLNNDPCLITYSDQWHVGVIGLISAKLAQKYHRPTITLQKHEDVYIASARSIESFDIMVPLHTLRHYFLKYGGHKQAAGFSLPEEHLCVFIENFRKFCADTIDTNQLHPSMNIDCELQNHELNTQTFDTVSLFSPFGMANEIPLFYIKGVIILHIKNVGNNQKHLKFDIKTHNKTVSCIGFHKGHLKEMLHEGDTVDIAFYMDINEWQGQKNLQLKIEDIRLSDL